MMQYGIQNLKEIGLYENQITSKGVNALVDALEECDSCVSRLTLARNQIDDESMKKLGEFVEGNTKLEMLDISSNKITDKGIEILTGYIIGNTTLKILGFSSNQAITDASVDNIIEMSQKSYVTQLDFWGTSLTINSSRRIQNSFKIPIAMREIPMKSNTKSAAKIS